MYCVDMLAVVCLAIVWLAIVVLAVVHLAVLLVGNCLVESCGVGGCPVGNCPDIAHVDLQKCNLPSFAKSHANNDKSLSLWWWSVCAFMVHGRDEHGSGLDRTGSRLKPILAGAGLDRTAFFLIVRSGLDQTEKICYFNEIIQPVSKYFSCNPILHRLAKLKSIFCHQWQKVRVLVQDLLSECRFRVHILGLGSSFAF